MARFRGTVQGGRGEASRLGHASTGLTARADGWHIGGVVAAFVDSDGEDRIDLYATAGSGSSTIHVGQLRWEKDEEGGDARLVFIPAPGLGSGGVIYQS